MRRTNADHVELESALQELALNLRGNAIETNMALWEHRLGSLSCRHLAVKYMSDADGGYILWQASRQKVTEESRLRK